MTNREPMEGEELIRLSLEAFHVQLQFESTILQIGAAFRLSKSGGDEIRVDPVTHHGDVGPLWSLIGERARSVTWADEIEIVFTNGAQLVIPAAIDKAPRGTLYGIRRGPDDPYMVEDF